MAATIHQLHPEQRAADERERVRLGGKVDTASALLEPDGNSAEALHALSIALTDQADGDLATGADARALVQARRADTLRQMSKWWALSEAIVTDEIDLRRAEEIMANAMQALFDEVHPSREQVQHAAECMIGARRVKYRWRMSVGRVAELARRAAEAWSR